MDAYRKRFWHENNQQMNQFCIVPWRRVQVLDLWDEQSWKQKKESAEKFPQQMKILNINKFWKHKSFDGSMFKDFVDILYVKLKSRPNYEITVLWMLIGKTLSKQTNSQQLNQLCFTPSQMVMVLDLCDEQSWK